jgi:modification methylase
LFSFFKNCPQTCVTAPYLFKALLQNLRPDCTLCLHSRRLVVKRILRLELVQKPQALLYRILMASSKPGDVVLDPFFGTGTTGAMAKLLHRQWIGIEKDPNYIEIAKRRIAELTLETVNLSIYDIGSSRNKERRIPFSSLLETELLKPGQALYFRGDRDKIARIKTNAHLIYNGFEGSIHQVSRMLTDGSPSNGWEYWYYEDSEGSLQPINTLREIIRQADQPD